MNDTRTIFHEGELAIQKRLGVVEKMDKLGRMIIREHMPDQHREFYENLPMIFAGYSDDEHNVWASVITGEHGFIDTPDDKRIHLDSVLPEYDPLKSVLESRSTTGLQTRIGLLGIDLSNRRRNRMSAELSSYEPGNLQLDVVQTFGNCPQYIQTRDLVYSNEAGPSNQSTVEFESFDTNLKAFIKSSDTFFVASSTRPNDNKSDPAMGADVSHRGGQAGFVRVDDELTLTIPDYSGNNAFNTLGNIAVNPNVGLLFIDFNNGDIYSMTGTAEIIWNDPDIESFKGALRLWRFKLKKGFIFHNAMPWRFEFNEWSPNSLMTDTWEAMDQRKALEEKANSWHTAKVEKTVDESPSIKSFYLALEDGVNPEFKAGQFITIGALIDGEQHTRTYSISSAPLDNFLRISVKRDGLVSNWLHDNLNENDSIQIKLPQGGFFLDEQSELPSILISAGVGITPMVSMLRQSVKESLRIRESRPVLMINTFRKAEDQAFFNEVNQIVSQTQGEARALWLLTRPESNDEIGKDYSAKGRLNKDILQQLLPIGKYNFYLCGPGNFMQKTYDLLIELGVADENIKAEAFGPASLKRKQAETPNAAQKLEPEPAEMAVVEFKNSQVEQAWSPVYGNLLDFAEAHGLTPEFGCRNGSCGSCKVKVLEGKVTHQGKATYDFEGDEALICCAVPAKTGAETERLILKA